MTMSANFDPTLSFDVNFENLVRTGISRLYINPNSHLIAITTSGAEIDCGELQGEPGVPGYTPVKGTDYWTAEDIALIKGELSEEYGQAQESNAEASASALLSVQSAENAEASAILAQGYASQLADVTSEINDVYELIETIIVNNDVAAITRSLEPNGTPYDFKRIMVYGQDISMTGSGYIYTHAYLDVNKEKDLVIYGGSHNTNNKSFLTEYYKHVGFWTGETSNGDKTNFNPIYRLKFQDALTYPVDENPSIKAITISATGYQIGDGIIQIWGVRNL